MKGEIVIVPTAACVYRDGERIGSIVYHGVDGHYVLSIPGQRDRMTCTYRGAVALANGAKQPTWEELAGTVRDWLDCMAHLAEQSGCNTHWRHMRAAAATTEGHLAETILAIPERPVEADAGWSKKNKAAIDELRAMVGETAN